MDSTQKLDRKTFEMNEICQKMKTLGNEMIVLLQDSRDLLRELELGIDASRDTDDQIRYKAAHIFLLHRVNRLIPELKQHMLVTRNAYNAAVYQHRKPEGRYYEQTGSR